MILVPVIFLSSLSSELSIKRGENYSMRLNRLGPEQPLCQMSVLHGTAGLRLCMVLFLVGANPSSSE